MKAFEFILAVVCLVIIKWVFYLHGFDLPNWFLVVVLILFVGVLSDDE